MKKFVTFFVLSAIIILSACSNYSKKDSIRRANNEYAQLFEVNCGLNDTILKIKENLHNNSDKIQSYRLTHLSVNKSNNSNKIKSVVVPLKRVICMSTGHLAYLNSLNELNSVVAVSGSRYIINPKVNQLVEKGKIVDVGYEGTLNYEMILSLKPDMVFTYGITGENNSYIDKLRQLGIPVLVIGDYIENHPLGKLEYLKLFGALFKKSAMADSIYNSKKEIYLKLKTSLDTVKLRPKVLLNAPFKETWYLPGAESYITKLIMDSGADVLGAKQNSSKSGATNIEEVYKLSLSADFWLNPNSYRSINALTEDIPLFKSVKVVKRGLVYNNINKASPSGGSDFWEGGVTEPEIILMDLVKIFHPHFLEKHELKYYIKLE